MPGCPRITLLRILYLCPYITPSPDYGAGQPWILSLAPKQGLTGVDGVRPGLDTVPWEPQRLVKACTGETGLLTTWVTHCEASITCGLLQLNMQTSRN